MEIQRINRHNLTDSRTTTVFPRAGRLTPAGLLSGRHRRKPDRWNTCIDGTQAPRINKTIAIQPCHAMKFSTLQATLLSTAFLAACGGGGGDGGTATPVATATLNSENQNLAAQEVISTAFLPLFGVQTLTGAHTADESLPFRIARAQLDKLPAYLVDAKSNTALTGAVLSETYNCTHGGSMTVSASTTNSNGMMSAGDSATIIGNNCIEPEGTINGSLGLVISSLSGEYGSTHYSAGVTMTFNEFTVANPQYSASMNGAMSLSASANGVNSLSQTFSTPSFSISATYAGVARSRILAAYSATSTRSPNTSYGYLNAYTASGVVTSSALSSQPVSFHTATPFVARPSDDYPSSGVMTIIGAANSQLKVTALSSTQVRHELDANGDGTHESSATVNWNTLL